MSPDTTIPTSVLTGTPPVHGVIGGPKTLVQWRDYIDALNTPFDV